MVESELSGQAKESDIFVDTTILPVVTNPLVLQAFKNVDRRNFVPENYREFAYEDKAIDLADLSSISQPSLVALMVDHLRLTGKEKVLEVGTASGFSAAIISQCASHVDTLEIDENLAVESSERLRNLGYSNVSVHVGDGALGLPNQAPFDAIIVTASVKSIPKALLEQLADGGKILIPVGEENPTNSSLIEGNKIGDKISFSEIARVAFYPLISSREGGWSSKEANELFSLRREMLKQIAIAPDLNQLVAETLENLSIIAGRQIASVEEANEFLAQNPHIIEALRKPKI